MILSGILLTPTGVPYKNSSVRITANNTSEQVLKFVHKEFKTGDDGGYEIDVPNGWYHVSIFSLEYRSYVNIGNIEVTDLTTETTLDELLMLDQTAHSDGLAAQVAADAASALVSKNAAAISATQAATSATNASNSATASANSAAASQTSATNSQTSASSSASSASASQSSAVSSASSASTATTQATASAASAQDSLDSANDAQASADLADSLLVTKLDVTKFSEIRGLASVAALRLVDTTKYTRASTLRYDVSGEGGYGDYSFIATASLPTDNGVTVIRSTDGLGYWVLNHRGVIDVQQAGVKSVNSSAALNNLNTVLNANPNTISKVLFSAVTSGQYNLDTQVLMSRSNITYELFADIVNSSLEYRTFFTIAKDLIPQPSAPLTNVTLIGNGHKIDGNGAAILAAMGLGPTTLPPTFAPAMFNYIDNLKIHEVDFSNGVYDSCQLRQCRNHKITKSIFRDATQYLANGLNITTNWATYVRGDYSTYSYGVVEDCVLINNASVGGAYYRCAGGVFRRCIARYNGAKNGVSTGLFQGAGFSYESPSGSVSAEYADGVFDGCISNFNGLNGYYINTPGVTVNDTCSSRGNGLSGYASDVDSLHLCGVLVVGVDLVTVLGSHMSNVRHGVSFLGATGAKPTWIVGGECSDNAGCGINIQGLWKATVLPGTRLFRNGKTNISSAYAVALNVSNSTYNRGAGSLRANNLEFDGNGSLDILVNHVRRVHVSQCESYNPNESRTNTNGVGFSFNNITRLRLHDNLIDCVDNGKTTNGYVIDITVANVSQYNNKSTQASGTVVTNNASVKLGISSAVKMNTGTHTTLTALPATSTATLANVADVLATLIVALQDGVMQG